MRLTRLTLLSREKAKQMLLEGEIICYKVDNGELKCTIKQRWKITPDFIIYYKQTGNLKQCGDWQQGYFKWKKSPKKTKNAPNADKHSQTKNYEQEE